MRVLRAPLIAILPVAAMIYGPWLFFGAFVRWDLNLVLDPLRPVGSLSEYLRALVTHRLWDFQPVRDFSYFIDLELARLFGNRVFMVSNLILYLGILFWIGRLIVRSFPRWPGARWAVVVLAAHPSLVNSVCWIAARKHLLSAFFILAATDSFLRLLERKPRERWKTAAPAVAFALSVLSQPITLLWPLWAWLRILGEPAVARARARPVVWAAGFTALVVGFINLRYYGSAYTAKAGLEKWVPLSRESLEAGLLAQGRYFLNSLLPLWVFPLYAVKTGANRTGLVLAILGFAAAIRALGWKTARPWLAFYLLPLLVVTFPMTHVFALDAYLLTPLAGFWILLTGVAARVRNPKLLGATAAVCGICFLVFSTLVAADWQRDSWLWARVLTERDSEFIRVKLADALIREGDFAGGRSEIAELEIRFPASVDLPLLYARAIYFDPELKNVDKLSLLAAKPWPNGWLQYYRGSVLAAEGQYREARKAMETALLERPTSYGADLSTMTAEAEYLCRRASPAADCGSLKDQVRAARPGETWDETAYQTRQHQLIR